MPYAVSEHTKAMLCQALKKKMVQKPLDKITIRELADDCGLKRQAFYYHFQDIYDLVRWMFQQEAVSLLRQHDGALLWQEGLLQLNVATAFAAGYRLLKAQQGQHAGHGAVHLAGQAQLPLPGAHGAVQGDVIAVCHVPSLHIRVTS